jgi:hypothetical protein
MGSPGNRLWIYPVFEMKFLMPQAVLPLRLNATIRMSDRTPNRHRHSQSISGGIKLKMANLTQKRRHTNTGQQGFCIRAHR